MLLTNEQRKCFALPPIEPDWREVKLPRSKYDHHDTYIYITPDMKIAKMIETGAQRYNEYSMDEQLTSDGTMILPKTEKGKPVKLSPATITKKSKIGVALLYCDKNVYITNFNTLCDYYRSPYAGIEVTDFPSWAEKWCADTGARELREIEEFASGTKKHIKFKEGDFFRFRLYRNIWGYGRIIIDFADMRKKKIKFWDIFFGKPVLAGVYHIVTERADMTPDELEALGMIPPQMIMDNVFYYGECEIIGNKPLDWRDYECPVHYGFSYDIRESTAFYCQYGKNYSRILGGKSVIEGDFRNGAIGFTFDFDRKVIESCAKEKSNQPYWEDTDWQWKKKRDLRHPENAEKLKAVKEQFGLE